jgi:hypothetical protein
MRTSFLMAEAASGQVIIPRFSGPGCPEEGGKLNSIFAI